MQPSRRPHDAEQPSAIPRTKTLTPREREVAAPVTEGMTNASADHHARHRRQNHLAQNQAGAGGSEPRQRGSVGRRAGTVSVGARRPLGDGR
jgi:hypothetical protein